MEADCFGADPSRVGTRATHSIKTKQDGAARLLREAKARDLTPSTILKNNQILGPVRHAHVGAYNP